jgi:hypothetical protein
LHPFAVPWVGAAYVVTGRRRALFKAPGVGQVIKADEHIGHSDGYDSRTEAHGKTDETMTRISVRVTPRAREDTVIGWQGDVLRVRVQASAERGKANEAVCRLIAKALGVSTASVGVVRGVTSHNKLIWIDSIDEHELRRRLGPESRSPRSGIMKEP